MVRVSSARTLERKRDQWPAVNQWRCQMTCESKATDSYTYIYIYMELHYHCPFPPKNRRAIARLLRNQTPPSFLPQLGRRPQWKWQPRDNSNIKGNNTTHDEDVKRSPSPSPWQRQQKTTKQSNMAPNRPKRSETKQSIPLHRLWPLIHEIKLDPCSFTSFIVLLWAQLTLYCTVLYCT